MTTKKPWAKRYKHQTQHPEIIKARTDLYLHNIALHQQFVFHISVNNAIRRLKGKKPQKWPLNPFSRKKGTV